MYLFEIKIPFFLHEILYMGSTHCEETDTVSVTVGED